MSEERPALKSTAEQEAVVAHPLLPGHLINVDAYAGAGKTTALEMVARRHSGRRILYLCFNKANALEGKRRMPDNVKSSTVHSLAYAVEGRRFSGKLGELRAREIMDELRLPDSSSAQLVIQTIGNFLRSPEPEMSKDMLPLHCATSEAGRVLVWADKLWKRMCDPHDTVIRMSHDGYLKLWLQGKPIMRQHDLLLVDEAQDLDPLTLDLALRQQQSSAAGVVMVGDPHQAIYSWRGAINAMEKCKEHARDSFILSECFRFPQAHADAAAAVLFRMKKMECPLKGRGNGEWSRIPSRAILARTNARLISRAMGIKGPKHFAATSEGTNFSPFGPYRFQEMLDVLSIYQHRTHQVKTPYLRRFRDYSDLKQFAVGDGASCQDIELLSLAQLAEEYAGHLPLILDSIVSTSGPLVPGTVCFSSGHRAKGLEWDQVEVESDFIPVYDNDQIKRQKFKMTPTQFTEEANLLYVALTRARVKLDLAPEFNKWLSTMGVNLPNPSAPAYVAQDIPAVPRADSPLATASEKAFARRRTAGGKKRATQDVRGQGAFQFS